MPQRVLSMSCWKVLPALHMLNFMRVNMWGNRPNGVVMAIFGMSAAFIGTWLYPFFRYIFEKWVHPAALAAKSSMFGIIFFRLCRPLEANLQLQCQPCQPTNQELTCSCRSGDAGFEPRTVILQPGVLPMSHHTPPMSHHTPTNEPPNPFFCGDRGLFIHFM